MARLLNVPRSALAGLVLLFALIVLLAPGPVLAGLSLAQIDSLKAEAKAQGWTFQITANPATQYSIDQLCGLKEPPNWREGAKFDDMSRSRSASAAALPSKFDWRTQITDGLPPVRNQLSCGSCWAFSTVGAFECAIKIKDGVNVDLSEQYLVSCNQHGWGCGGGWWAHDMHTNVADACGGVGAVMDTLFPYQQADVPCNCPYKHDYKLDGWSYIGGQWSTPTVEQIKQAIIDHGPVSVAVSVNNAFQAYGGGVFNGCQDGDINHAVVLVGWDDSQGPAGVWIMRNSWGPWWGEGGGYMRIPYDCSMIGYNSTYVNYRGRVAIQADTTLGQVPLAVNFSVGSALQILSCSWTFGDNSTSTEPNPSHVYTNPGEYTVGLTVQCPDGPHTTTSNDYVAVYADSVLGSKVNGVAGQQVVVDIYARNYLPLREIDLPITWAGSAAMNLDSVSTAGLRTAYMGVEQWINFDPTFTQRGLYQLATNSPQPALAPGNGSILRLYFTLSEQATGSSNPVSLESYDNYTSICSPSFVSTAGAYVPFIRSAQVTMCKAGDVNNDGQGPDLMDLSALVNFLTSGGYHLQTTSNANVNGVGPVDISDLSYLVAYLTGIGNPPRCP